VKRIEAAVQTTGTGAQDFQPQGADLVGYALFRLLFEYHPDKHGPAFCDAITTYMKSRMRHNVTYQNECLEDLLRVQPHVPKEDLYEIVPHLITMLDDSHAMMMRSHVSPTVLDVLAAITGKTFASARSGRDPFFMHNGGREIAEKYREYYYRELLPARRRPDQQIKIEVSP
jgi:hypothetical protein